MSEPTATCWSCGADRAPADALCPSCGKVQPPAAREKVLEAKMEGGKDGVEQLSAGIRKKRDAALKEIASVLRDASPQPAALSRVSELLARLRYYARYLDEAMGRAPEL